MPRLVVRWPALFLTGLIWGTGSAADAPDVDEILVTATRRAATVDDTSHADSSYVPADGIGLLLITDLFKSKNGIYLQQTTPGQGAAIIRGLKGSAVLHLVDGSRLNNNFFRDAPTQYLALVDPNIVNRAEIVRASAASLYGSDAMGGVIQLISRRPQTVAGSQQWKRDIVLSGHTGESAFGASTTIERSGRRTATLLTLSGIDSGNRRTAVSELQQSGYQSYAVRAAHQYRPGPDSGLFADIQWLRQPSTSRVDELVPGFGQQVPSSSEFEYSPNQRTFAHIEYVRDAGILASDWDIDLAWQRIDDDRVTRDFDAPDRRLEQNRSNLWSLNVVARHEATLADAIYGIETTHDRVQSSSVSERIDTATRTVERGRFPDDSFTRSYSAFAHIETTSMQYWQFAAGVRWQRYTIDLGPEAAAGNNSFSDAGGDFSVTFRLSESTTLHANAGRGFRMPNIFDAGTLGARPGNRFNIPNESLMAESVMHYDAGVTHSNANFNIEFYAFDIRYNDRILSVFTGDLTPSGRQIVQSANLGAMNIHGVEFRLSRALSTNWALDCFANYQRGSQRRASGGSEPADRMPPLNARVKVSYNASNQWSLQGGLTVSSGQSRLSSRDKSDPRIDPLGTPGYATLDLSASYDSGGTIRAVVGLENMFDRRYRHHGSGLDEPGRSVVLRLNASW